MVVRLTRCDSTEFLETDEDIVEYLNAAAEDGDPALIQAALGDVAKAIGMRQIAEKVGVGRESLYKSLSESGNHSFQTIQKVIAALGGKITITPANKPAA